MSNKPEREALKILKEFDCAIPVDIHQIIQSFGIKIIEQSMEDSMSGILVIKDSQTIIGINQSHPPNRKRFSLAHELGHYLLHRNHQSVFIDPSTIFFRNDLSAQGIDRYEIEANIFAAELLMPKNVIHNSVQQSLDAFDERAVARLALRFGVSNQALTIRLTKLGLISA